MITLLNTSFITAYGQFSYQPITLEHAQSLVADADFQSAIGHEATAQILTTLLGVTVPVNRIEYKPPVGGQAIVFRLNGRPPEGKILSIEEMKEIGFSFGLLVRTA